MSKLIPKKQTAWGKLEYKGPQYSQVVEQMKKEEPQAYNRLQVANARSQQPNSEVVRWKDANGKEQTSTTNIGISGTDPIGQLYVEGVVLNPVFKGLGRVAEYGLAKAGNKWARAKIINRQMQNISADIGEKNIIKKSTRVGNFDFFDETLPQNISPIDTKKFFQKDLEARARFLDNAIMIPSTDDWYKYKLVNFTDNTAGIYDPNLNEVLISKNLDKIPTYTTKIHEFRHKLEQRYKLNPYQQKIIEDAYRLFKTRPPKYEDAATLSEKVATNTELRYKLYYKFMQANGREPKDIYELNTFIDNLSGSELKDELLNINGYGNDYVQSFVSRLFKAKDDGYPKEIINEGVQEWVNNIKNALKYVPSVSGVTLIPKNKNTQPGN